MRQITAPDGKVWDVDQIGSGSAVVNLAPGARLPDHTLAIVRVSRPGESFAVHITIAWRSLNDAALWEQVAVAKHI